MAPIFLGTIVFCSTTMGKCDVILSKQQAWPPTQHYISRKADLNSDPRWSDVARGKLCWTKKNSHDNFCSSNWILWVSRLKWGRNRRLRCRLLFISFACRCATMIFNVCNSMVIVLHARNAVERILIILCNFCWIHAIPFVLKLCTVPRSADMCKFLSFRTWNGISTVLCSAILKMRFYTSCKFRCFYSETRLWLEPEAPNR